MGEEAKCLLIHSKRHGELDVVEGKRVVWNCAS